jgi:hypothetical protein
VSKLLCIPIVHVPFGVIKGTIDKVDDGKKHHGGSNYVIRLTLTPDPIIIFIQSEITLS